MPTNLLILPLLGGFLFLHLCNFVKFWAQLLDGYRLLLYSALAGFMLSVFSRIALVELGHMPALACLGGIWGRYAPQIEYVDTAVGALALGPVLACLWNLFEKTPSAVSREINRRGNTLLKLLHRAVVGSSLISVTLDNRKWYVGYVTASPNLRPTEASFDILPVISGYRDTATLETRRTTFYAEVLSRQDIDPMDFAISIPFSCVKMASLFDPRLYDTDFSQPVVESSPAERTPPATNQ